MGTPAITITPDVQQNVTITPDKQQPGFVGSFSKQMGVSEHPVDQLISELQRLKAHPVDTLWESVKAPVIGLRDLTYGLVTHPVDTVAQVTGGKDFANAVNSGNYKGALGTLAAAATQAAMMKGPKATVSVPGAEGVAERLYQSALKPGPGSYSTSEVKSMVNTGLENAIPVSKSGMEKLDGLVADLNNKVKARINAGAQSGATVDPQAVAQRADQTKAKFAVQVNPNSDLAAIDAAKKEFLDNNKAPIPVDQAQAMKQGTYQQIKGKAYGEMKSATVEAQKALARGIKEELQAQFPEIKGLNAKEGQLIELDGALERAVRRIDNHQLMGIGTPAAVAAGGVATGTPVGAAAAGMMKLIIDNPEVKSKLARVIWRSGKGVTFGGANAKVAAYADALNRANFQTSDERQQ